MNADRSPPVCRAAILSSPTDIVPFPWYHCYCGFLPYIGLLSLLSRFTIGVDEGVVCDVWKVGEREGWLDPSPVTLIPSLTRLYECRLHGLASIMGIWTAVVSSCQTFYQYVHIACMCISITTYTYIYSINIIALRHCSSDTKLNYFKTLQFILH
jgi:hypothetical protein